MSNIHFAKGKISVHAIGKQRFWIGIAVGFISAIAISLFFNYSREAIRVQSILYGDLLILEKQERLFFDYFFSLLASVLGLCMTIWIWLQSKKHTRKKESLFKGLSITNSSLIFWVILMMVSRFGSIFPIILMGLQGIENYLDGLKEFWILLLLLPLMTFLQSWQTVRLVYQTRWWIVLSFICCVILSVVLQKITAVNQEKVNKVYFQKLENEFSNIDEQVKFAKEAYYLVFDPQTIKVLKMQRTVSSLDQIDKVKKAFSSDRLVSLDTILLQKMILRNFKEARRYNHWEEDADVWMYATPKNIRHQLNLYNENAVETKELFAVLHEIISTVNTPKIPWDSMNRYSALDKRRSYWDFNSDAKALIQQLIDVRKELVANSKYHDLSKDLEEIKVQD
ncbi:hypothetical protein [Penaeicola halotolerans]|uniref:hypothetical protein n=1 Tax=Penaeicola halotolerans TaxID=2793196 RepID=UPI001CF88B33|nr:hypothetical protein [Penaeicola halotolerans]